MSKKRGILRYSLVCILLLATVSTVGMWICSYFQEFKTVLIQPRVRIHVESVLGRIVLKTYRADQPNWSMDWQMSLRDAKVPWNRRDRNADWHFAGFSVRDSIFREKTATVFVRRLSIPYWFLSCLLLLPSTMSILKMRRWMQRRRAGQCEYCGYDLRASTGNCPECGNAIPF